MDYPHSCIKLSPFFVHPKNFNVTSSFSVPFIFIICIPIAVLMNIFCNHQYACMSRRKWYPKTSLCNHLATWYDVAAPSGYIHKFLGVVLARHLSTLARIINNLCKPGTTALTTLRTRLWESEQASAVWVCAWSWACVCVWKRAGKRVCVSVCVSVCVRLKENENNRVCVSESERVCVRDRVWRTFVYERVSMWGSVRRRERKYKDNGRMVLPCSGPQVLWKKIIKEPYKRF